MRSRHPRAGALTAALAVAILSAAAPPPVGTPNEMPFMAENDEAMDRMMRGMAISPTGDIDRDFAIMMIAHHQGAIDMAEAQLRYGHNEQLRRIAQEIIVTQMQEIAVMRLAIGDNPAATPAIHHGHAPQPDSQP